MALTEQAVAPGIDEVAGEVEVVPFACRPVELDQGHLDLGMPGHPVEPARAEDPAQVVSETLRHGEQPVVTKGAGVGEGRLDEVTGAVELVGGGQVGEPRPRCPELEPGIEVTIGCLGHLDQRDALARAGGQRGLSYDGLVFPDTGIDRLLVDGFWRGALVARWTILAVDGHRSYLPDPDRAYVRTGESFRDHETFGWTATKGDIALARLLQELLQRPAGEFERYIEQAGIVEIPDE